MNIEGVPDSIEWAKVRDFLESIGLDLSKMPGRHGGVEIAGGCIRATVHALNDKGERYVDRSRTGSERVATHQVCIPIVGMPNGSPVTESLDATCVHVIQDDAPACDCGHMRLTD